MTPQKQHKNTLALARLLLDSSFSHFFSLAKGKRKRLLCRLKCDCWASLTNETCYCHLVRLKTLWICFPSKNTGCLENSDLENTGLRPQTSKTDLEVCVFEVWVFEVCVFEVWANMRFRETCPKNTERKMMHTIPSRWHEEELKSHKFKTDSCYDVQ